MRFLLGEHMELLQELASFLNSNILAVSGLLVAIFALFYSATQAHIGAKATKASILVDLFTELYSEPELQFVLNLIYDDILKFSVDENGICSFKKTLCT